MTHDVRSRAAGSPIGERAAAEPSATATPVGRVAELWRYPVKSMLGTRADRLVVTARGVLGDRAWALRDLETGRVASAKRFHRLLDFRAGYERQPAAHDHGRAWIRTPGGEILHTDDPDISERLSRLLGHPMQLEDRAASDEKASIDRKTVFGDVPVSDMKPEWTPETMPDYFQLMSGTFLEIGPVHVLASGSVDHLRRLQRGTAQFDRRRFRTNIYIDTADARGRFVEDDWTDGALHVGHDVVLTDLEPTVWCVTSTLAQQELPRDLSVLRTIAQHHRGCLGVYASVPSGGAVRVGDPITLRR